MSKNLKKITIIKPDDWHVHLRDNDILKKFLNILENFINVQLLCLILVNLLRIV